MDTNSPKDPEAAVRELLRLFVTDPNVGNGDAAVAAPLDNPNGLLAEVERWEVEHPGSALGMTRAAVAAVADPLTEIPFGPLLVDLFECVMAFGAIEDENVDEFLRLRAPRIVTGLNGRMHWALLTALTDREALVREIVGPKTSPRPHHRTEPPTIDVHLIEAHHAPELRSTYGLTLRQALDIEKLPPQERVSATFGPLLAGVKRTDPAMGAALEWLMNNDPEGLLHMPLSGAVTDAIQGETTLRPEMRLRFAHLLPLGPLGYCAYLVWDSTAPLSASERATLAGNIRQLSDTAVAPWNHWRDIRTRREAFAIWVRSVRNEPPEAKALARVLRARHSSEYANESEAKTVGRIYRLSAHLSSTRLPRPGD